MNKVTVTTTPKGYYIYSLNGCTVKRSKKAYKYALCMKTGTGVIAMSFRNKPNFSDVLQTWANTYINSGFEIVEITQQ